MQITNVQKKLIKASIIQSFQQRLNPIFASNPLDPPYKNPIFEFRAGDTVYGYTKGYGANKKFYVLIELDNCNLYVPIPIENTTLIYEVGYNVYNDITGNSNNNGQGNFGYIGGNNQFGLDLSNILAGNNNNFGQGLDFYNNLLGNSNNNGQGNFGGSPFGNIGGNNNNWQGNFGNIGGNNTDWLADMLNLLNP